MPITPEEQSRLDVEKEIKRIQDERIAAGAGTLKQAEAELKARRNLLVDMKEISKLAEESLNTERKTLRLLEQSNAATDDQIANAQKALDKARAHAISIRDQNDALAEGTAKLKEQNETGRAGKKVAGDILNKTKLINTEWKNSGIVGTFATAMDDGQSFSEVLSDVGANFEEMLSPANIFGSVLTQIIRSTISLAVSTDQTLASFNAATGFAGKYNQELYDSADAAAKFGVSMEGTGKAGEALAKSMSSFTSMGLEARAELVPLAAALDKVGLSGAESGKMWDNAMKGWGMTATEAGQMTLDLKASADALGIPMEQMGRDFNASMKELAKYGPAGVKIFKNLAATAKIAGVEMDTLMTVAGKFDTIEGAAQASGELNAILGGNMLNSMQMLNATEDQRIKLLQQAVAASGKSWQSLDRFEQQAIASAAGISDMNDANKMFGQSLSVYDGASEKAQAATMHQNELAEATKASATMGDKFAIILERMAIGSLWLVEGINWILDGLLAMGGVGTTILAIMIPLLLWGLIKLVKFFVQKVFKWAAEGISAAMEEMGEGAAEAIKSVGEGLKDAGEAIRQTWPAILAMGVAFFLMGAGIFLVVYGIVQLVEALKGMTGGEFVMLAAILIGIGVGMWFLIPALIAFGTTAGATAYPLLALGLAFLMIGGAVLLAGVGIKIIAEAILLLVPHVGAVFLIVLALGLLAGIAVLLGWAGPFAVIGLGLLAVGLGLVAAALLFIKTKDLEALGNIMMGLGMAAKNMGGLASAGGYIKEITKSLKSGMEIYYATIPLLVMLGSAFITFGTDIEPAVAGLEYLALTIFPAFAASLPMWEELIALWTLLVPIAQALAAVMIQFALWGESAAIGLWWFSFGMHELADAVSRIDKAAVKAVTNLLTVVRTLTTEMADLLWDMSDAFWNIGVASWGMDEGSLGALADVFEGLAVAVPEIAAPGAVESVEKMIEVVSEIPSWKMSHFFSMMEGFMGGGEKKKYKLPRYTPGGEASPGGGGGGGAGTNTIILQVDGRELGRAVTNSLNEVNNMALG